MTLTKVFFKFFLWVFLFQFFLLVIVGGGTYLYEKKKSQFDDLHDLISVDSKIYENIIFQHKMNNFVARDLIAYKLIELNNLNSVEVLDLQKFEAQKNKRKNCSEISSTQICFSDDNSYIVSYIPLKFDDQLVGFLSLEKHKTRNIIDIKNMILMAFALLISFIANLFAIIFLWKKLLKNDLDKLVRSIRNLKYDDSIQISEYEEIQVKVFDAYSEIRKIEKDRLLYEKAKISISLSRQIAHDIRSPLEALRSVTGHIDNLDFQHRKIITSSIQRISDIANGLLREGKTTEKQALVNLNILLDELYQDKVFEHGPKIKFENKLNYKDSFINGDENTLYRIFSNLINNAFESYDSNEGDVAISLEGEVSNIVIKVQDFGKGMSKELITKVLEGGTTTKEKGNGLGVSSAFEEIKKYHGTFEIDSEIGLGTTIVIKLAKLKTPSWFADHIEIDNKFTNIICVDDDPGFLEVYQEKLKDFGSKLNCVHPKNLTANVLSKDSRYFFDYDLGKNEKTGLDIILENKLESNSTLVTSMYQDENIQKICIEKGIKILPKQIFNNVKVNIKKEETFKIVFIDDDEIMHLSWNMEASKKDIPIKTYFKVEDFLKEAEVYTKDTKIFIDSDLGEGLKGEIESKKIFDLGFSEIFLATGYSPEDIDKPEWIKEIVGKRPSFS